MEVAARISASNEEALEGEAKRPRFENGGGDYEAPESLGSSGLKKKLLRHGCGFELPDFGDEVTKTPIERKMPTLTKLYSMQEASEHNSQDDCWLTIDGKVYDVSSYMDEHPGGDDVLLAATGKMVSGLDRGIITMKKLEKALITLHPELAYGEAGTDGVPPNSVILFKVELLSWIPVIDIFKDGGVIKRILVKGEQTGKPYDKDEVIVRYDIRLADGTLFLETPEEGVEFSLNEGHLFPTLPKAVMTMNRKVKVNLVVQPKW